jgi:hypothetical protein
MTEMRWVIVCRRQEPRQAIPQPYVWDHVAKRWISKVKALKGNTLMKAFGAVYSVSDGTAFKTKEEAESVAVFLAAEQPECIGKLRVEAYKA